MPDDDRAPVPTPRVVDGARFVEILAGDDPRVAEFRRLNDAAFRRSLESPGPFDRGMFVIEGWLALERAIATRHELRSVLVASSKTERAVGLVAGTGVELFVADPSVIGDIVGFDLHRGVVATATRRLPMLPAQVIARSRRLLLVEGVNDGENLGALFRTAAGLGADGMLLDPTCPDPLARRSVRVSLGHVLAMPWAVAPWPSTLDVLRRDGWGVIGLSPSGATPLDEVGTGDDARIAVVVGAEGPGLSVAALDACTSRARIPMSTDVDSLNVATAAAIALWHLRPRR